MTSYGRTALYRAFDSTGGLLYVGISAIPEARMARHRSSSTWYRQMTSHTVEWFSTRVEAMAAESAAVKTEHPIHNRQLKGR